MSEICVSVSQTFHINTKQTAREGEPEKEEWKMNFLSQQRAAVYPFRNWSGVKGFDSHINSSEFYFINIKISLFFNCTTIEMCSFISSIYSLFIRHIVFFFVFYFRRAHVDIQLIFFCCYLLLGLTNLTGLVACYQPNLYTNFEISF